MDNSIADNRGFYTLEQAWAFQELPAQRQHVSAGYAQQNHFSPPKFTKEERSPLQTHFTPTEGKPNYRYSTTPPNDQSGMTDLAKYLIWKEVVSSGLLKFDDRPENYWAWEASIANSTIDLNLSAREEMDLLTKWLRQQSAEKAKRIHAVHIHNVSLGLQMLWRRLEETYRSAEMIENSLLMKSEEFPKITHKDNQKFQDLGDLLLPQQKLGWKKSLP